MKLVKLLQEIRGKNKAKRKGKAKNTNIIMLITILNFIRILNFPADEMGGKILFAKELKLLNIEKVYKIDIRRKLRGKKVVNT